MNGNRLCLLSILLLGILMPLAKAQDNAIANGSITDSTGALVPNAAIVLANPATGFQARAETSNSAVLSVRQCGHWHIYPDGFGNGLSEVHQDGHRRKRCSDA